MDAFEAKDIVFLKGGVCGFPVRDGASKRFQGLEQRDSRPFEGVEVADQATLRIEASIWALIGTLHHGFTAELLAFQWSGYPSWYTYVSRRTVEVDNYNSHFIF